MLTLLAVAYNHRIAQRGDHAGISRLQRSGLTDAATDWLTILGYTSARLHRRHAVDRTLPVRRMNAKLSRLHEPCLIIISKLSTPSCADNLLYGFGEGISTDCASVANDLTLEKSCGRVERRLNWLMEPNPVIARTGQLDSVRVRVDLQSRR